MRAWGWLLGLFLVACAWMPDARAADQGEAYSDCHAQGADILRGYPGARYRCDAQPEAYVCEFVSSNSTGGRWVTCAPRFYFAFDGKCSDRSPTSGGFYLAGEQSSCTSGCRYDKGQIVGTLDIGGKRYYQSSGARPTGAVCTYDASKDDTPVADDQCQQTGTLTQCVTKDGKHCAVASTGRKFCWQPTETGTKVSGNEAATKAPQGSDITPPPKPPADGGEWKNTGSGTVSAGGSGGANDYTVTNWKSNGNGKGGDGGGSGDEEGKGSDGKGDVDGKGDKPGGGVGDLYKGTDKSIAGLMGNFYAQASNAPVMKGITHFMDVGGGGSCPVFTVPASTYWKAMTFDAHCSGTWLQLLQAMGWIVLAIAAYIAVRIAVT